MQRSLLKNLNMRSLLRNNVFRFILRIECKQIRIVVHFELRPRYIGTVQKYFTNKLCSLPEPITITSSLQSALYFHYYNDYDAVGVLIRFGIRLPNAYIRKFDYKIETFSEIDLKFDELEKIYQSLTFLVKYVTSFQLK